MTDINGVTMPGAVHQVERLELGRGQVTSFPILFAASPTFASLHLDKEPALILGMQELRLFRRVAIDFAKQQILFDPPPSANFDLNGATLPG
jgi:hypothetical protein